MTSNTDWDKLQKRLDNVKKPVRTFKLCEDPEVRDRYLTAKRAAEEADAHLKQAKEQSYDADAMTLMEKLAKEARADLTAAQKTYDAHTVTLRFQALERNQLKDLMAKHPPTEQEEADGKEFAEETFAPELIAAASMDGMPAEAAARYLETWTAPDARGLWNAAWSVQHTQRTDLGKG
jgi:hypothetical protein